MFVWLVLLRYEPEDCVLHLARVPVINRRKRRLRLSRGRRSMSKNRIRHGGRCVRHKRRGPLCSGRRGGYWYLVWKCGGEAMKGKILVKMGVRMKVGHRSSANDFRLDLGWGSAGPIFLGLILCTRFG